MYVYTDMSDSNGSDKVDRSLWLQRLQSFEYFVLIHSQCHMHLGTVSCMEVRTTIMWTELFVVCVCVYTRACDSVYSASDKSPTVFSTFCLVFILHTTFTASCCACMRVGMKSPLRIHSLLSTL